MSPRKASDARKLEIFPQPVQPHGVELFSVIERSVVASLGEPDDNGDGPFIQVQVFRADPQTLRFETRTGNDPNNSPDWGKFYVPTSLLPHLVELVQHIITQVRIEGLDSPEDSEGLNEQRIMLPAPRAQQ